MERSIILGTGSYIPEKIQKNEDFSNQFFFTKEKEAFESSSISIANKLQEITGIHERRYAADDQTTSDIAFIAAERAIEDSGIDKESIDQIIVAHNFGDIAKGSYQSDMVPSLAARVKHALRIKNPTCTAYDILFGCPGWIQGLIQADAFGKGGLSKTALIIGTEMLSRVVDPYDRDSMIFGDGAGACILQYQKTDRDQGILATATYTHSYDEAFYLCMSSSYHPEANLSDKYLKMDGRKVYEYALKYVPQAMKDCLDKSGYSIGDVKQIFIHQANEKLDFAVVNRFYKLFGIRAIPEGVLPMTIQELGNSSVATVPTLLDLVRKEKIDGHRLHEGDVILFASIGAGMSINAICYRV